MMAKMPTPAINEIAAEAEGSILQGAGSITGCGWRRVRIAKAAEQGIERRVVRSRHQTNPARTFFGIFEAAEDKASSRILR